MASVKELYDYIKLQIKLGKSITPFHQAIVDAYEKDEVKINKVSKEIQVKSGQNLQKKILIILIVN